MQVLTTTVAMRYLFAPSLRMPRDLIFECVFRHSDVYCFWCVVYFHRVFVDQVSSLRKHKRKSSGQDEKKIHKNIWSPRARNHSTIKSEGCRLSRCNPKSEHRKVLPIQKAGQPARVHQRKIRSPT